MVNLAAFRYRAVTADRGGPIARLELSDFTIMGERRFLASAFLRDGLAADPSGSQVYSGAHGSGVASSPMVARFMAISEAMERWAHWQLHRSEEGRAYGFDADSSSNGMAAYPGLFARQARPGALLEAAERFNLLHWWEGRLCATESAAPWPGVRAVTICSEAPGVTVIVFRHTPQGFVSYGHAAAADFMTACGKAALEMERHATVLDRFALAHAGKITGCLAADAHPIERRSVFFATEAGHELFRERVRSCAHQAAATPRLVFDGAIAGPWSQYADVWRVVYAPPSDRFLSADENYFFW